MAGPVVAQEARIAEALARAAGLQRAWDEHEAEVVDAVAALAELRAAFSHPPDPASEPLPAWRAPERAGR
jgi:hypothetical protein